MQICPLASGSSGNCTFVGSNNTKILIDAGISARRIARSLNKIGVNLRGVDALLITHEHLDHCREASKISKSYQIPIYLNQETFNACRLYLNGSEEINHFETSRGFHLKDLFIYPFPVFHDAISPSGFRIKDDHTSLGIAVDLGVVTGVVKENLRGCDAIILESNHDLEMLIDGDYPWHLKQRIRSQVGHLSNRETGKTIRELLKEGGLKKVYLAHLSQNNNRPEIAISTVKSCLKDFPRHNLEILLTWHHQMSKYIRV